MNGYYEELTVGPRPLRLLPCVHVLHGRVRPRASVHRSERPHARARRASGRDAHSVRAARPHRAPARGGAPLSRPRREGDQAPPESAGVRAGRRAPPAHLRARRRALRPDPHPRRARPSADRGAPRAARSTLRGGPADHRPRGDRGHGRSRRPTWRASGRLLRHLGVERRRSLRPLSPGLSGADRLCVRLPVRAPAELAAHGDSFGKGRRIRRKPAPRHDG